MHFEILVEDPSGKKALDILIPKIFGAQDTFRVIAYQGVGCNGQRQCHSAGGTDISVCAHTCWGEKPDLPVLVKTQGASLIKR